MKYYAWLLSVSVAVVSACSNTTADVSSSTQETNTENEILNSGADNDKPMVPSVIFIQYLNQQAPMLLCQQDPGIACLQMPVDLCQASVEASADRCGPKLLGTWPASFEETEANAIQFSKDYRNCMLKDWVEEYGLQESRLASCGIELE
jgi:hypothetical protein